VDYQKLGNTGLEVSRLCIGMMGFAEDKGEWKLSEDEAEPIIRAAVEGGVTFFDTAESYSDGASERVTGRLLPKFLKREDMVVSTKVHPSAALGSRSRGLGRKRIMAAIDGSLTRLGMEYVDVYQIHRWDPDTPIEETMAALDDVVRAGKARYIGASSMCAWQFTRAQRAAERAGGTKFISMQNHYNLLYREEEREMIPFCIDDGVGVIPYSPLARGLLAGNRTRDGQRHSPRAAADNHGHRLATDADFDVVDRVVQIAHARQVAPAQIALAWLHGRPGIAAPIVGATKVRHVTDALAAETIALGEKEVARLEEAYVPHLPIGHR
jgi:aryl-alcohol dehydrogenase-like predicted oxidoreductase